MYQFQAFGRQLDQRDVVGNLQRMTAVKAGSVLRHHGAFVRRKCA